MSKLLEFLDFSCFAEVRSAGAGTKKDTFLDTISLTLPHDHDFGKCHSELDSCPFDPTLVSAASSVTELRIETRVGPKGPEQSSGRHLRVPKWRKKVNFLAKSSGKIGGFSSRRTDRPQPLRSRVCESQAVHTGASPPRTPILGKPPGN